MKNSEKRVRFNLPQEHQDYGYKNDNVIRKYTQPNNTVVYHYIDPETKKSEPFTGIFYDLWDEDDVDPEFIHKIRDEKGNQIISLEIQMKDGLKHGFFRGYNIEGTLSSESYFINGEKHGVCKFYHDNGQIWEMGEYINDKKNGLFRTFDVDGKLKSEIYFEDGIEKKKLNSDKKSNNIKEQKIKIVTQNNFELGNNEEFKNCISQFSIDYINDLEIEIKLKKGCGVEIIDFNGEYKGHRYTINGGDEVKWFETEYEEDIDTFIEEVGDEEIYDLENTLSFNFFPSDSYGFYGKSIKWEDGTPDNIINEINDEGFDKLLSECIDNGDYDSVDTELNGDSISSIQISFNYNGSDISIHWINED